MAKKFMYVCLGILALVVAYHLGAQYGQAGYVDYVPDGIVAIFSSGAGYVVLDNGEVWHIETSGNTWVFDADMTSRLADSGVPISQMKFIWNESWFVTQSNELWKHDYLGWHNCGSPPGGVATQPTTWGHPLRGTCQERIQPL
jgi:hypothetical protein